MIRNVPTNGVTIKRHLGIRIAKLRKKNALTQEKLAEKANYSVEFISFVERGINAPSLLGCERIANALNVEMKDLFDFN